MGAWFFHAWGIIQGSSLLPRPDSDVALFVFLGIIGLLIAGLHLGIECCPTVPPFAGPLFPQLSPLVRLLSLALMPKADALSSWESIIRQESLRSANR